MLNYCTNVHVVTGRMTSANCNQGCTCAINSLYCGQTQTAAVQLYTAAGAMVVHTRCTYLHDLNKVLIHAELICM